MCNPESCYFPHLIKNQLCWLCTVWRELLYQGLQPMLSQSQHTPIQRSDPPFQRHSQHVRTAAHMRTCTLTAHQVTWEYVHRKTCSCQNWKLCLIIYRQECSEEACRENKLKRCTWIEKCHKDNKQYSLPHGEYYQLDTSVLEVRAPGLKESFMKSMVNWRRLGKNKQCGRGRQRESQVQENEDRRFRGRTTWQLSRDI